MFCRPWRLLKKKSQGDLEDRNKKRSSQHKSKNSDGESEDIEGDVQDPSSSTDTPVSAASATEKKKKKKKPWWHQCLFPPIKVKSPSEQKKSADSSMSETAEIDSGDKDLNTEVAARIECSIPRQSNPTGKGGDIQAKPNEISLWAKISGGFQQISSSKTSSGMSRAELNYLGLPNLAQTCYMNSTLQALLTLSPFIEEVSRQETIWRSHYSSHLTRGFVDLRVCRLSNKIKKKSILVDIKRTVARFNAEFADDNQKDAHEFLSCVLDMLRLMSSDLQRLAKTMGLRYTCPVTEHILFKMLNMRTCKGCGIQFGREEDHINLLLVPVGSVTQCLKEYLKEHEVSYCCDCGAEISSQQRLFLTLPNVLILQLKRFRFTETFDLKKVKSPIILSRELEVNPVSSSSEQMRYSLVSIISHLGSTAHAGHYVCDGAYRDTSVGTTDCWLTYNDKKVSERTGASVCQQRAKTAYLLFYEKQL